MKNNFQIMKLNIEANLLRIEQLMEIEGVENQFNDDGWYSVNKPNAELRQRLKLLRKDTLNLEKLLKSGA